jgi:hypothetical protein
MIDSEMQAKTKIITARVLHSQLVALGAPNAVTNQLVAWITEIERDYRSGIFNDDVAVDDVANVELVGVRGLKQ